MKKTSMLFLTAFLEQALLAHNLGEHGTGAEGLLHYLTEWHHGGPLWIAACLLLGLGAFYFKKTKTQGK